MSYFDKFKRHPPVPQDEYFAQLSVGAINRDEEYIRSALEETEVGEETFPNLSLGDLQIFWDKLQQDTVIPTGQGIPLGVINFATHGRKDAVNLTGLSFEKAKINPESENFVIETVQSTLNDPGTRNSDVEYEVIEQAMKQLIHAALQYTTYTEDDMPQLPTKEEYEDAISEDQDIKVEPRRVIDVADSATVEETPPVEDEQVPAGPMQPDVDMMHQEGVPQNTEVVTIQTSNVPDAGTFVPQAAPVVENPGVTDHVNQQDAPKPPVTEGELAALTDGVPPMNMPQDASGLIQSIVQFKLDIPQLPVDASFAKMELDPTDVNYVKSELEKEKQQANEFLLTNGHKFEIDIRKKLLSIVDTEKYQQQLNRLVDSNWQDKLKNKLRTENEQRFSQEFDRQKKLLDDDRAAQEDEENQRHRQRLREIKRVNDAEIDKLKSDLDHQAQQELTLSQQQAIGEQQLYLNGQITALEKQFLEIQEDKSLEVVNNLKPNAMNALAIALKSIKKELAQREDSLEKEHQKAIDEENQQAQQQKENTDLVGQQKRLSTLQNSEAELAEQVHRISSDLQHEQDQNLSLKDENRQLQEQIAAAKSREQTLVEQYQKADSDNLFKAAILNMNQPKQSSKAPIWILSIITLFGVMALGGGAAYTYEQQQHFKDYQIQAEQRAKHQDEKIERLKKSDKSDAKQVQQKPFKVLDASIRSGSLSVYDESFKNADLQTEDRTLKVGNLLIEHNRVEDAWKLANANHGHNQSLIEALEAH